MSLVEVFDVTKQYANGEEKITPLDGVSLHVEQGDFLSLMGASGSGKSTLLNLITGQLRPTLGTVTVFGARPFNNVDLFRRIGVCPEHEVLYANVTGLHWVRYLMELHGFNRREALAQAEQALDDVGMTEAMCRPIGGYSRGMRQRTKLAQALAHDPELLILDEPLSGLDPVARMRMTQLLRRWVARGKGLLFASHMLHEVEAITESFLLICGGRLLAAGTAEEVDLLLAEVPKEIRIRCDDAAKLAQQLVQEQDVDSIRFAGDGDVLIVSTRSPTHLYAQLPAWTEGTGIRIRELQSTDETLQRLIDSLLQIHRGAL